MEANATQNKTQPAVELDFYKDWIAILRHELAVAGHKTSGTDSPEQISLSYFNLLRRTIWPKPRAVRVSKEFYCPPKHVPGVELIKKKILSGENLGPHLSNTVRSDPKYDDLLLNDWGIHHLHLGTTLDTSSQAVKRTGPVLFARCTENEMYLINVYEHGAWTKNQLIEILHTNWPDSIKLFRCPGVVASSFNISETTRKRLRSAGVVTACKLSDGTMYLPPGGGYMSTGLSTLVLMESDRYTHMIRNFERYVREQATEFVRQVEGLGKQVGPTLKFQFVLDKNDKPFALETTSGVRLKLRY